MTDSEVEPVTVLPVAAAALSSKALADAVVLTPEQLSSQVISVVTVTWESTVPSCNLRSTSRLPPLVPMLKIVTVTVFRRRVSEKSTQNERNRRTYLSLRIYNG